MSFSFVISSSRTEHSARPRQGLAFLIQINECNFQEGALRGLPPSETSATLWKASHPEVGSISLLLQKSHILGLGARGQYSPIATDQGVCVCVCVCVWTVMTGHQ